MTRLKPHQRITQNFVKDYLEISNDPPFLYLPNKDTLSTLPVVTPGPLRTTLLAPLPHAPPPVPLGLGGSDRELDPGVTPTHGPLPTGL